MESTIRSGAPWRIEFDQRAQLKAAIIAIAFAALFWTTLRSLAEKWYSDPDWSHGMIIPLFSAYLVAQRWDQISKSPIHLPWLGLPILVISVLLYGFTFTPVGRQLGNVGPYIMMVALLGVVILLCGVAVLRYAWLPWAYLLFAIPLPKALYFTLTDPLRRIAATVATAVLQMVPSLDVERVGSNIEYNYDGVAGTIGVADACSGMRSTITLCALGVAVAYMVDRPWWQRLILVLACIPIATFCNLIRVIVTSFLHIFVNPKYAEGTYHLMLGMMVLLLAFAIFSGLGWLMSNLVVEADDEAGPSSDSPARA